MMETTAVRHGDDDVDDDVDRHKEDEEIRLAAIVVGRSFVAII